MMKVTSIAGRAILRTWLKRTDCLLSDDENSSFCIKRASKTITPINVKEPVIAVAVAVDTVDVVTTVEIIVLILKLII